MDQYALMYNEFLRKFPNYSYNFDTISVLLVEEGALLENESAYIQRAIHTPIEKKLYLLLTILPHKDLECHLGFVRVLKKLKHMEVAQWLEQRIRFIVHESSGSASVENTISTNFGNLQMYNSGETAAASRSSSYDDGGEQRSTKPKNDYTFASQSRSFSENEPFIVLPIAELKSDEEVGIKNCVHLGSYNNVLVCDGRRDILVLPGIPHQLLVFCRVSRDRSTFTDGSDPNVAIVGVSSLYTFTTCSESVYRDPQYNNRSMSMNLALLAVLHSKPATKLDDFDYVIDHQDLLKLFEACCGHCSSETIFVELVGDKTVVATSAPNHFLHAFKNVDEQNSLVFGQNQRIVAYELGTLRCMVRFRVEYLDLTLGPSAWGMQPSERLLPAFAGFSAPLDSCPEMRHAVYGHEYDHTPVFPRLDHHESQRGFFKGEYANFYFTASAKAVIGRWNEPQRFTAVKSASELHSDAAPFRDRYAFDATLSMVHDCMVKVRDIMMAKRHDSSTKATLMWFDEDKLALYERDGREPSSIDPRIVNRMKRH